MQVYTAGTGGLLVWPYKHYLVCLCLGFVNAGPLCQPSAAEMVLFKHIHSVRITDYDIRLGREGR